MAYVYSRTSYSLGENIRPETRARVVREMSRETMPAVRDVRIEWGVTMT